MNAKTIAPILAIVAGVLLVALAVLYLAEPAASLPAFIPGHVGAGDPEHAHHHVKHAIAAIAVAAAAFAYAWFNTGQKAAPTEAARPS
jgi:drug/metabolite transporter (DMT)-like permease